MQGQLIPAPQDLHPQLVFDLRQIAVVLAAEVDQQTVVGEFEKRFLRLVNRWLGRQRANGQGILRLCALQA